MEKKKSKLYWFILAPILALVIFIASIVGYSLYVLSSLKSCDLGKHKLDYVSGDLLYAYNNANTKETVSITGISEEGAKKEHIYFPSEIEGLPVTGVYKFIVGKVFSCKWNNAVCKKIYMQKNFNVMYSGLSNCKNLKKLFVIEIGKEYGNLDRALHQYDCYVAKLESPTMEELLYNNACTVKYANISYNYNYEDSENYGVYFIDDCDYGSKIEYIPANPTREGYTFDGWYKEPECINKWNFESDTLPEEEVNENNEEEVKFQETKLYAKWNKQ
jgi:hypothetical protein